MNEKTYVIIETNQSSQMWASDPGAKDKAEVLYKIA